ncbi:NFX1-type zinc finger-containing protein 1 [Anopheles darlingi]|uniref:NFX1-type zinc finger-containing protein 1 n=1 Tax=Anopheles darlingi TaxID=43151 RepID=UPI0021005248|nr:NFX1-type zinc finger-containing protein 1 [Anopheles darlingi]
MSDSLKGQPDDDEDDWFDKDEDDFVVERADKPQNSESVADSAGCSATITDLLDNLKCFSADYDGNYVDPNKNDTATVDTKFNLHRSGPGKYVQTIPYTKLVNIVDSDSLTVLAEVCLQSNEFMATLQKKTYGPELMLVLMRIMIKLTTIPLHETVRQYCSILISQDHFWEQLTKFFDHPPENEKKKKRKKNIIVRPTIGRVEMVQVLIKFLTQVKQYHPLNHAATVLCRVLHKNSTDIDTALRDRLAAISAADDDEWQGKMTIYPSIRELKETDGPPQDLKRNIVKGRFESVQHYLEVHLNLLKEDFMIPLRTSLQQYRLHVGTHGPDKPFVNENVRIHHPVVLLLPAQISRRSQKEQLIVVDLDPTGRGFANLSARYNRLNLPATKRFMHGSLLLFSSGLTFDDLMVAIVSHRDSDDLKNGFIYVEIIRFEQENAAPYEGYDIFNRPFVMVESEIFFEPYHQVFNALVRLRAESFPLKSYIIDVQQPPTPVPEYALERSFRYADIEFDLKKPDDWPADALCEALGLNRSQYEAYKLAISNRFALIQGPPGTGKTFIGLKIVETLLANTDRQILLVCVTNHALDQFLCGVTRFTDSVVRMGNQSKHPLLDVYNIKQLNEEQPIDQWVRTAYYNTKQDYLALLEQFEKLQRGHDVSNELRQSMIQCMDKLQQTSRRLNELSQASILKSIRNVRVIAMTTTFAARNRVLLELLGTPIVVIEEAAEVLEAHIVASLTVRTQHCILIGDHKQLRPTTSTYVLSVRYKLDLSLFERMINNRFSVATMLVQHRMRPEVANLLRPTIYRVLHDAESVSGYPTVVGMQHSLFFLTHNYPEGGIRSRVEKQSAAEEQHDEKSKRNIFECKFVLALCEYLLAQGPYTPEDITILTAYNGQLMQFLTERKTRHALRRVRIAVIDSFQGEESKIVLLSLVRSGSINPIVGDSIGFLAHENRICVALSRAREGFYIIGNMGLLAKCSKKWAQIEKTFKEQAAIGESIALRCQLHGTIVEVKDPDALEQLNRNNECACSLSADQS